MATLTPEQKKQRLATGVKWGLGLAGAVVVSPFIFLAVKGAVGLAIAGAVGLGIINFAPVVSMKFANWKLKAIKHEAKTNPIETLQNVSVKKKVDLNLFAEKIRTFSGRVRSFSDKVDGLKVKFPQDAKKFDEQLAQLNALLAARKAKYKAAQEALEKFDHEIERAQAIWEVALAAKDATQAAGGNAEADALERIKAETAVGAVQDELNAQLSELETALLEEPPETKSLPPKAEVTTIDITPAKEKVRR